MSSSLPIWLPLAHLQNALKPVRFGAQAAAKSHTNCAASLKYNCYLVRADTHTASSALILKPIEPLNLTHYGNEFAEKKELKTRLKWSSVYEAGKFYDHQGAHS
ncbi:MAG: hypothetical protein Q9202_006900 [Teloschistes flavicans]